MLGCFVEAKYAFVKGKSAEDLRQIAEFSKWVLDIGDSEIPATRTTDSTSDPQIIIPDEFLIRSNGEAIKDIVNVIYPDFLRNVSSPEYLSQRSILAPTNSLVGDINDYILDQIPGEVPIYIVMILFLKIFQVRMIFSLHFRLNL